jgi:uncharacterized delta-60 repeat protein
MITPLTGSFLSDLGFAMMLGGLCYAIGMVWHAIHTMKHDVKDTPRIKTIHGLTSMAHGKKPSSNFSLFVLLTGIIAAVVYSAYSYYVRLNLEGTLSALTVNKVILILVALGVVILGIVVVIALVEAVVHAHKTDTTHEVHKTVAKRLSHHANKKHVKHTVVATMLMIVASAVVGSGSYLVDVKPAYAAVVDISGTVYTDEGVTNIGAGKTVNVMVNGVTVGNDDTDASGNYSVTGITTVASDVITAFIDNETEDGVVVTISKASTLTGLDIYQNELLIGSINEDSDGTRDTIFSPTVALNNFANSITTQDDGKIIIGGGFTNYDGQANLSRIARLNRNGTRDTSFVPTVAPSSNVYSIALQTDGKIIIAGAFTDYDGQANLDYIARLNSDGTRDTSFVPTVAFNQVIENIIYQTDGKFLVSGEFTDYDGQANLDYIARLNSDGTRDTSFVPTVAFPSAINTIDVQTDGKLIFGGTFTDYDGQANLDYIARLNSDGTRDTSFVPTVALNGNLQKIKIQDDGMILVGGAFTNYDGQANIDYFARLNSDGTRDTSYAPTVALSANVLTIGVQDNGKILVGGNFINYDGQANLDYIARLNSNGTRDTSFVPTAAFGNIVRNISIQPDGKIIVSGDFLNYDAQANLDYIGRIGTTLSTATLTNLNTANNNDADITAIYADGATATLASGKTLYVASGINFAPGAAYDSNGNIKVAGTLTPSGTTTISVAGDFTNTGTVTYTTNGTLTFDGTTAQTFTTGGSTYRNIRNSNTSAVVTQSGNLTLAALARTVTIDANAIYSLDGNNITTATIANSGTLRVIGSETITATDDINSGTIEYVGDGDSVADTYTIADYGATDYFNLTINGTDSTDVFQLGAGQVLAGSLTITNGIYSLNGQNVTIPSITNNTGTFRLQGGETITTLAANDTNSGTWEYVGNGVGSATTHTIKDFGATDYFNLLINDASASNSDTFQPGAAFKAAGSLTVTDGAYTGSTQTSDIDGSVTIGAAGAMTSTSSATNTIGGDFSNSGTFTHNSGTITFDPSVNHTLSGATTWNNLNFSEASNDSTTSTITFPAGVTQTIEGIMDLDGLDASDKLEIVSSSAGSAATLNFIGTSSITSAGYLSVKDNTLSESSSNVSLPFIPANSTNISGNTNWFTSSYDISGTIYTDEGVTNIGSGKTIKLLINGASGTTTTTDGSGAYTFSSAPGTQDDIITVFIDGETEYGVTIDKATGSNMTGVDVYQNRLITRRSSSDSGAPDTSFNPTVALSATVKSVAVQTDGKIVVGGDFTNFNGDAEQDYVARLNSDGTPDTSFNPTVALSALVRTVAVQTDGKILVGGQFTNFNGDAEQDYIARLNSDGTPDTSFNPTVALNGFIDSIVIQTDGKIVVGGSFTNFNGDAEQDYIARLNSNGTPDTSFNPTVALSGFIDPIVIQTDGKILVGGQFTNFNGDAEQDYIARLNSNGTPDTSFNPTVALSAELYSVAIQDDGKILVGGNFLNFNGDAEQDYIARLNSNGTPDTSFNPTVAFTDTIQIIAIQDDGKILVGGDYLDFNGDAKKGSFTRINSDGTPDTSFNPTVAFNATTTSIIIQDDGKILVGGLFTNFNGDAEQDYIARLNGTRTITNTNLDTANDGDADITAIYSDGSSPVIASGKTLYVATDTKFQPGGAIDSNGNIKVIGTLNTEANTINVAGDFTNSGTLTCTAGTDLTFDGGTTQTFNPGPSAIDCDVVVSNASTVVALSTNALNIGTNDLTINNATGVLSLAGMNLTADVLANTGTLRLRGSETVTLTTQDTDSGTWEYIGDGDTVADTFSIKDFGATDYYSLVLNSTDVGDVFNSPATMTIAGNFTNTRGFAHNSGAVTFSPSANHTLSGATTWNTLNFSEASDDTTNSTITFPAGVTQTIVSGLTLDGLDANDLLAIVSSSGGSPATIDITAASTLTGDFLSVTDHTITDNSSAFGPLPYIPTSSTNGGGNTGWFASGYDISGTVYTDEGVTNIGTGKTVNILVNGVTVGNDDTDASGNYSVTGVTVVAGDIVTAFIDGETEDGVTFAMNDGANMTGLNIYQDHAMVLDADDTLTMANINTGNDGDADIITIITDAASGVIQSGKELYIGTATTFAPGAALDSNGSIEIVSGATLNAAANAVNVADNFVNAGTFTHTAGTDLTFDGGDAQTFNPGSGAIGSDVVVSGAGTIVALSTNALNIGTNDLTINNATGVLSLAGMNLTADVLANTGTLRLRGSETVTLTTQDTDSGTWEYIGDGDTVADTFSIKDFGATDYYNLTIASTDSNDTYQLSTSLNMGGGTTLVSAGTFDSNAVSTLHSVLTISGGTYLGSTNTTATNGLFTVSGGTFTGGSGAVNMSNGLTISSGTFTASSGTTTLSVGNFTRSGGTFNHNSGTFVFGSNIAHTVSGSNTWNNLSYADTSNNGSTTFTKLTLTAGTTQSIVGTLTLNGFDASDMVSLDSSSAGVAATIDMTGTSTLSTSGFLSIQDNTITDNSSAFATPVSPANSTNVSGNTGWFGTPTVTSVSASTSDGSYNAGDTVDVTVTFSESVTVTGTPTITLETGATDDVVNYTSGSPGTVLTFTYTIGAGDTSADLDYVGTTSLALNAGTINATTGGTPAVLTLATPGAANSLGANKAIVVDTTADAAPGTPDMTAGTDSGSSNSDNITSDTTPTFDVSCVTGSTVNLIGSVTGALGSAVCAGSTAAITATAMVSENVSATQTDPAGNVSVASSTLAVTIDTTADAAPGAPDMTAGTDLGSSATDNITSDTTPDFTISCVTGSTVTLSTGGTGTCASSTVTITSSVMASGTVTATQTDTAGNVSVAGSGLAVTIDTTADAAPGTPNMTAGTDSGSSDSDNITSDTTPTFDVSCVTGSTVNLIGSVTGALGSAVCTGSTAAITATAMVSENVSATQTDPAGNVSVASSTLAVTIDSSTPATTGTPDMTAGTDLGSSSIDDITSDTTPTFDISCETGTTVNLIGSVTGALGSGTCAGSTVAITATTMVSENVSATQTDTAGNTSAASTTLAVTIDSTASTVSGVSASTSNGTYKAGDSVAVQVNFSENVIVSGTPQITLETGTTDRVVNYTSGTGTSTLVFTYTVQAGDTSADLDYVGTTSLALNGGTITDTAGNTATLTLATPGAANSLGANKAIVIDTTAPTVSSVSSSTGAGSYNAGDVISIQILFSEIVTVTGTPQLTLETGTTDRVVDYVSGTGTNTLTFTYTVQAGDTSADLDYVGTTSLTLNGGTILDGALNAATLTLATPGAANSLGANEAFIIDTTADAAPGAPNMTAGTDSGSSSTDNNTSDTTPNFDVSCVTGSTVNLIGSVTGALGSAVCAGSTAAITATAMVSENVSATQTDPAGNVSVASSTLAVTIDTTAPSAPTVTAPTTGSTVPQTVTFTGACETGATVSIAHADITGTPVTGTCAAAAYSINVPFASIGTKNNTQVSQTDPAGNTSGNTTIATLDVVSANAVTINQSGGQEDPTDVAAINFDVTFTTAIDESTFVAGDFTLGGTGTYTITSISDAAFGGANDDLTYRVVATATVEGTVIPTLGASVVQTPGLVENGASTSTDGTVTYDVTADAAPGTPNMTAGTDSGSSDSDNITSDTTPTFDVSCVTGSTVNLIGSVTGALGSAVCAGSTAAITATAMVSENVSATQTDPAGNVSVASSTLAVTIDSSTPATTGTPDMTAGTEYSKPHWISYRSTRKCSLCRIYCSYYSYSYGI